jgi:hypothetical protein
MVHGYIDPENARPGTRAGAQCRRRQKKCGGEYFGRTQSTLEMRVPRLAPLRVSRQWANLDTVGIVINALMAKALN